MENGNGVALFLLTDDDKSFIDKTRIGTILECDFKTVRNSIFYRKYFALLNLGFDYWSSAGGAVLPAERGLLMCFVWMFAQYGDEQQTILSRTQGVGSTGTFQFKCLSTKFTNTTLKICN